MWGRLFPQIDKTPPLHKTPIQRLYYNGVQNKGYGDVTGAINDTEEVVDPIIHNNTVTRKLLPF